MAVLLVDHYTHPRTGETYIAICRTKLKGDTVTADAELTIIKHRDKRTTSRYIYEKWGIMDMLLGVFTRLDFRPVIFANDLFLNDKLLENVFRHTSNFAFLAGSFRLRTALIRYVLSNDCKNNPENYTYTWGF